jgi:predicted  nucleic acid-binding Zn-ribbon protein
LRAETDIRKWRLEDQINNLDTKLQNANAEIEAMKEAHKVAQMTADAWERNFHVAMDIINDLQADYAGDYMSYRARVDACIISEDFDAEQINDLETTIRVLAGMVN